MSGVLSLTMAYRHVRAGFGRLGLSTLAVAVGVGLVTAFRLMNAAVLQSFLDTADAMAGRAALTVSAGEGVTFSEAVAADIAHVPGVQLAVPLVRAAAFPDDGSGEVLTVNGVDLTHEAAIRLYHDADQSDSVIEDVLEFLNQPDSVVVGREFAERRGLRRGDVLALVTPTGVRQFTVRGLLDAQGLARTLRGRLVVMDLYAAERAFAADGQINQIDIVVADGHTVEAVKEAVAARIPAGLRVEEPVLRKALIRKAVGGFQMMVTAFSLLAVLAGFVICYSRLGAVFEARTWEIGLLRAVGMPRGRVFLELLKESLVLGAVGTAFGLGLGVLIARYGLPFLAETTAIAFRLPIPSVRGQLSGEAFAIGAAVGLLAAVSAAVAPALRLARTQPVAALTMRGREMPAVRPHSGWPLRALLVALIAMLIIAQRLADIVALGLVSTALMGVTICTLAAPLIAGGGQLVLAVWQRLFGATGRVAARQLSERMRGAALTVATLGVGLGAVFLFGTLGWSFERTLITILDRSVRADLILSSAFASGAYWGAPLSEDLLAELSRIPGVAVAAGEQSKEVPYEGGSVFLKTFDPPSFRDPRVYQWPLEGDALPDALDRVAHGEGVIVTRAFAHQHRTRPGDVVELESPDARLRYVVLAVSGAPIENAVIMSRDLYRRDWSDPMLSLVHVVLGTDGASGEAEARISRALGAKYRLRIRSRAELIDYFAGQVRRAFSVTYLMEAVVFLLVLMGIGDTLATGVIERTREFGMMRAVGLSRVGLFGMVMLEGLAIGLLGLLLAAGAGAVLGIFWIQVQFPAMLGWKLDLHLPTSFALAAAALTLALCLIGSLVPSWRAAGLSVPEALRNE